GVFITPRFKSRSSSLICDLRETLLDTLEKSDHLTDCSLLKLVKSISIPECDPGNTSTSTSGDLKNEVVKLQDALLRYLKQCICTAVNAVCAPCDDTGVLLACLDIKDCEIVRICNLERNFVISGVSLRYWVPVLRLLGEALERFCCPPPKCDGEQEKTI